MNTDSFVCPHCGKIIKNRGAFVRHEPFCVDNPNRIPYVQKGGKIKGKHYGNVAWNRGKTYKQLVDEGVWTSEQVEHIISKMRECGSRSTGKASTYEGELQRRKKISKYAKDHNGGYRKGSGRGKKGWYQGIFCDSSWELAYVIYCKDTGKSIKRCEERRSYTFEGVNKTYLPDFVVDGQVIEIKGYQTEQWKCKQVANPDVLVLGKNEMQPILDFVVAKYGKDFIRLYERRDG